MNPRLIDFIVKHSHLEPEEIKPELRLAEDMGFYGLDAISFMEHFFTTFHIRNYADFDVDRHINGSVDFAVPLLQRMKNIFIKKNRHYLRPDLTMGHLEKVIERGSWFNEG